MEEVTPYGVYELCYVRFHLTRILRQHKDMSIENFERSLKNVNIGVTQSGEYVKRWMFFDDLICLPIDVIRQKSPTIFVQNALRVRAAIDAAFVVDDIKPLLIFV